MKVKLGKPVCISPESNDEQHSFGKCEFDAVGGVFYPDGDVDDTRIDLWYELWDRLADSLDTDLQHSRRVLVNWLYDYTRGLRKPRKLYESKARKARRPHGQPQ